MIQTPASGSEVVEVASTKAEYIIALFMLLPQYFAYNYGSRYQLFPLETYQHSNLTSDHTVRENRYGIKYLTYPQQLTDIN